MKKLLSSVLATCTFVFAADLNIVQNELPANEYIILEKNKISLEDKAQKINENSDVEIISPNINIINKTVKDKLNIREAIDRIAQQKREHLKQEKQRILSNQPDAPVVGIPYNPPSVTTTRTASELFFSEYGEGSSFNKWLEVYNGTGSDVDMSGYAIGICNNGHGDVDGSPFDPAIHPLYETLTPLTDTLANGDAYVITRYEEDENGVPLDGNYADPALGALMDFNAGISAGTPCSFNGNDWLGLYKLNADGTETLLDVLGPTPTSSSPSYDSFTCFGLPDQFRNQTLIRKSSVMSGNTDWASSGGTDAETSEWTAHPSNYWDDAGMHTMVDPDAPLLSEGFEGTFPPEGWAVASANDANSVTQYNFYYGSVEGFNAARFSSYSYADDYTQHLTTPQISLPAGGSHLFKFWYLRYSFGTETFSVGVSTTDTDPASFTYGAEVTDASASEWKQAEVDLSAYAGQDVYLDIKYSSNYMYYLYVDDVTVEAAPTFPIAELSASELNFGAVNVTASSTLGLTVSNTGGAELVGTMSSDNPKFTLNVDDISVEAGGSTTLTVTYTPGEEGDDTGILTFVHNGDPSTAQVSVTGSGTTNIVSESFEGAFPPTGWATASMNTSNDVTQSASYAYDGSLSARFSSYSFATDYTQYMMTPQVTVPTDGTWLFKFWYLGYSFGSEIFSVGVSTTDTDPASFTFGEDITDATGSEWQQASLSLEDYAGQDVYLAIRYTSDYQYYLYVDHVTVEAAPVVPVLTVGSESLLYPATALGETSTASFTVGNAGEGRLSGDLTYPEGWTGPASFDYETTEIQVTYSPTTSGLNSGTISITSNGGDGSVMVNGNAGTAVETFEGDALAGWEIVNNDGGAKEWELVEGTGHNGTGLMEVDYESSTLANDDWLISPMLDVVSGDMLSFFAGSQSSFYLENMNLMLSTSGGAMVSDFDVTLAQYTDLPSGWTGYEHDLSAYAGTQVRVAFVSVGLYEWTLQLDDVAMPAMYQATDPIIYDYPMAMNFGRVQVGASAVLPFDFVNSGGADLQITGVTFGENSAFSLSDQTPLPITTAPGGPIGEFHVVFSPTSDVDYLDDMVVVHNGMGDDLTIPLQGSGTYDLLSESFEGAWPPPGWQTASMNTVNDVTQSSSQAYEGTQSARFSSYSSATDYTQYLMTPQVSLPADAHHLFKLMYLPYSFGTEVFSLGVSTTDTDPASFTFGDEYSASYNNSSDWLEASLDLQTYAGQDVYLAVRYTSDYQYYLYVDHVTVETAPEIPILSLFPTDLVFPVTALGTSSSTMVTVSNVGAGALGATMTYPADISGPETLSDLMGGESVDVEFTYTPTTAGMVTGDVVVDATASNAAVESISVQGNAGEVVADMESPTTTMRWLQYSLAGQPWENGPNTYSDRWARTSGAPGSGVGHTGDAFMGVYSYEPYWGGVDDYLVSPRLDVEEGEVFSFWAQGGYGEPYAGTMMDNMVVYSATERPVMGYDDDGNMTGFTNMETWVELYNGQPSDLGWDAHEYTLSAHDNTYLIIHAAPNDPTGWMLKIDDVAHPDVYRNPNAVLNTYKTVNLGEVGPNPPTGADVFVQNSGEGDLIIESMGFVHGHDFHIEAPGLTFPVTLAAYETVEFSVVLDPTELGELEDHLMFTSNYDPADLDAFGQGTDHTVYKALVINGEPGPFTLLAPSDGTSIVLEADADLTGQYMNIAWNPSMDPDGEQIHYSFESTLSVEDDQGNVSWEMDLDAPLNALMNGGFEDGMEGWLVFQTGQTNVNVVATDETFEALEGMHALSIEPNHADGATYPNYTTVYRGHDLSAMGLLAGQELMVHGVAHPHGFESSENSAYMFVRFYDANSALVTPPGYTLMSDLIDTDMEMSGGADDGWYPLHMHVVVPEGAMYMDVGVEYVTSSAGHGGTVVLDEMGVFAPLTANSLTLSYDQALAHAIDDRVHHLSMGWTVYAMDPWSETQATNGPFTLTVDLSAYVDALAVDGGSTLPGNFALHNNYPNPFNPVTNITYDIPEVANVTLEIYNITGQKVRTLAQGSHEPGRYRVLWNATNDHGEGLSSGMYVYRIQAGDFVSTKKLVLMK